MLTNYKEFSRMTFVASLQSWVSKMEVDDMQIHPLDTTKIIMSALLSWTKSVSVVTDSRQKRSVFMSVHGISLLGDIDISSESQMIKIKLLKILRN